MSYLMWNHGNKGLRDYSKESVVELHALTISALHCIPRLVLIKISILPRLGFIDCGLVFGDEISWPVCGPRDLAFEKPGKIFNLTLSKPGSRTIGMVIFWDGTVSILKGQLEKPDWFSGHQDLLGLLFCREAKSGFRLPLSCTSPRSNCS